MIWLKVAEPLNRSRQWFSTRKKRKTEISFQNLLSLTLFKDVVILAGDVAAAVDQFYTSGGALAHPDSALQKQNEQDSVQNHEQSSVLPGQVATSLAVTIGCLNTNN